MTTTATPDRAAPAAGAHLHGAGPVQAGAIPSSFDASPLWDAPLLRCLSAGWASRDDMRYMLPVLSVCESTRRLCYASAAARLGSVAGATLSETCEQGGYLPALALWERELGGEGAQPAPLPTYALYFRDQCAALCRSGNLATVGAFLMTYETVAQRLRGALDDSLRKAGLAQPPVAPPAESLLDAIAALVPLEAGNPAADGASHTGSELTLALYQRLFDDLYSGMRMARMAGLSTRIQARVSLERADEPGRAMYPGVGEIMCSEADEQRHIAFTVERYPCTAETLDPRVVRIPPGKSNNLHKHAHETLFCFIAGTGRILVGETWVDVKPGDAVFAPRWAMHQTQNLGESEMVLLAITDYYLTSTVYVGKYDKI